MQPAIRIIIPCHNSARTIRRALASLEQQTFSDFEVVLVDDGSTDDTRNTLLDFQAHSPLRLTILSQRHAGAAAARNRGMEDGHTPFLMFLDSDDVFHPDMVRALRQGICGCDTAFCLTSRDTDAVLSDFHSVSEKQFHCWDIDDAMRHFMYQKEQIHFTGFLYRRELLEKHAIRFREGVRYGEDLEFVWKYLAHCRNACFLEARLYGYDDRPDSAVHQVSWSKTDLADAMLRTGQYLRKHHSSFAGSFASYMLPRAMWTVAKTFAVGRKPSLYRLYCRRYPLRGAMHRLAASAPDRLLRGSARLYLLHPWCFYQGVRLAFQIRQRTEKRRRTPCRRSAY